MNNNEEKYWLPFATDEYLTRITPTDKKIEKIKSNLYDLNKAKGITVNEVEEKISKSMQWYNANSINLFIPFQNICNIINSNALYTFFSACVNLLKGASYTDTYPESWRIFSQMYLTCEKKVLLYNEFNKNNNHLKLSYMDIEKEMSETFKNFILSFGKSFDDSMPVRNSLFLAFFNFLKLLFDDTTPARFVLEFPLIGIRKELYDNLFSAQVNQYSSDITGMKFVLLNRGIEGKVQPKLTPIPKNIM
jgi:hypothetical protein